MVLCVAEMRRQLSTRKIRLAMTAKGWEPKDLAYHAKLSAVAVNAILSGESGGRVASLVRMADALGVKDINSLFDRIE